MKATLDLEDELVIAAKKRAAEERTSLDGGLAVDLDVSARDRPSGGASQSPRSPSSWRWSPTTRSSSGFLA